MSNIVSVNAKQVDPGEIQDKLPLSYQRQIISGEQRATELKDPTKVTEESPEKADQSAVEEQKRNVFTTETIAYYNMGVNFEHLQRWADAIKFYEIAIKITEVHLPKGHALNFTI
jgi:hypothetical protein